MTARGQLPPQARAAVRRVRSALRGLADPAPGLLAALAAAEALASLAEVPDPVRSLLDCSPFAALPAAATVAPTGPAEPARRSSGQAPGVSAGPDRGVPSPSSPRERPPVASIRPPTAPSPARGGPGSEPPAFSLRDLFRGRSPRPGGDAGRSGAAAPPAPSIPAPGTARGSAAESEANQPGPEPVADSQSGAAGRSPGGQLAEEARTPQPALPGGLSRIPMRGDTPDRPAASPGLAPRRPRPGDPSRADRAGSRLVDSEDGSRRPSAGDGDASGAWPVAGAEPESFEWPADRGEASGAGALPDRRAEAGPAGADEADDEMPDSRLDAGALAEMINEVLVAQARRHGVDLS